MTNDQAIAILDTVTQPTSVGKLTRMDYVQTQLALEALQATAKELADLKAAKPVAPATAK